MSKDEFWTPTKIVWFSILAVFLCIAIPLGVWGLRVAFAGVNGRGNQIIQVNNATNRTEQYNHFFDLKKDYDSQIAAIAINGKALAAIPSGSTDPQSVQDRSADEQNVTGARTVCTNTANTYNEDSLKTTTGAQFKSWNLPDQLDASACQE